MYCGFQRVFGLRPVVATTPIRLRRFDGKHEILNNFHIQFV